MANYCRSPVVEKLIQKKYRENVDASSAGIFPLAEASMDPRSRDFLNTLGIENLMHTPKKITKIIIEGSDLVLALDLHVLMSLNQEFPSNMKKFKLLNYQNPSINIPDPYRLSDDEYLDVMKRIDTIVSELDINT